MTQRDSPQMQTWVFAGVVHPERAKVEILRTETSGSDRSGSLRVNTAFAVSCGLVAGQIDLSSGDRYVARMLAQQAVQRRVDILGFIEAAGYEVEIHTVVPTSDAASHSALGFLADALAGEDDRKRRVELVTSLPTSAFLGAKGVTLQAALADIRMAIRDIDYMGFFAYRAIEAIRQHFVSAGGQRRADSWDALHAALGTTRAELGELENIAIAVRHGESLDIQPAVATRLLRLAFRSVEQFMAHLTQPPVEEK